MKVTRTLLLSVQRHPYFQNGPVESYRDHFQHFLAVNHHDSHFHQKRVTVSYSIAQTILTVVLMVCKCIWNTYLELNYVYVSRRGQDGGGWEVGPGHSCVWILQIYSGTKCMSFSILYHMYVEKFMSGAHIVRKKYNFILVQIRM